MKYSICLSIFYLAVISALPTEQQVYRYNPAAKWISAPQRMMFMRYVQPHYARSSQAAALVAEEGVAASGTVLQDTEGVLVSQVPITPVESTDEQISGSDVNVSNVTIPEVITAIEPEQENIVPRDNRVFIELGPTAENEIPRGEQDINVVLPPQPTLNDDETEIEGEKEIVTEQEKEIAPKFPTRLPNPVARRPINPSETVPRKPLSAGTFFPVDFGGVQGGAIAIAHSLSTDNGGAATSNAIAYGTPGGLGAGGLRARRH